jgi:hypothetical protein
MGMNFLQAEIEKISAPDATFEDLYNQTMRAKAPKIHVR